MKMLKNKPLFKILALSLAVLLAGGTAALLYRPALKVAARSELIALWRAQGADRALGREARVKIQWVDYGTGDIYQRVLEDLEKPAGELPDVYLGLGLEARQITALAAKNALVDIGAAGEQTPQLRQIMRNDTSRIPEMKIEGRIYSFPSLYEDLASIYPQKAWINTRWLEAAGLSQPTTPEQLRDVLKAFKTLDSNGNRIADEVPLGAAYGGTGHSSTLGYLIAPFLTTDYDLSESNYLNVEKGKVYAGVTDPKFKEALAYLRSLYAGGLMDKAVFTQKTDVLQAGGEKYGVILAQDITALLGETRAADYAPLPPLTRGGHSATLVRRAQVKTGGFLIPAAISPARQKRALALGDAMLSPKGTAIVCFEGAGAAYGALRGGIPCWECTGDEITRTLYAPVGELCIGSTLPPLALSARNAAALSSGNTYRKVIDLLTGYTQAFVTGKKSLDKEWDAYLAALDKAGLRTIVSYTQEAYDQRSREGIEVQ